MVGDAGAGASAVRGAGIRRWSGAEAEGSVGDESRWVGGSAVLVAAVGIIFAVLVVITDHAVASGDVPPREFARDLVTYPLG